jgi:PTH2 family peptidyl-tRNA hydrolase
MPKEVKQVIIVRSDIRMSRGKLAAQVAHASLESYKKADFRTISEWSLQGSKKVILKAKNLRHLMSIKKSCEKLKLPHALITDAGKTELRRGTVTCLGIGPAESNKIDKITGSLPLLR